MMQLILIIVGLASCVEVWHPKDLEPPLFRCDICDFDTNFKHIVEHLMGKQHKMEYFVSILLVVLYDKTRHQVVCSFPNGNLMEERFNKGEKYSPHHALDTKWLAVFRVSLLWKKRFPDSVNEGEKYSPHHALDTKQFAVFRLSLIWKKRFPDSVNKVEKYSPHHVQDTKRFAVFCVSLL